MILLKASSIVKVLFNAYQTILNTILPLYCPVCDAITSTSNSLCHNCWRNIEFIGTEVCNICGYPLQIEDDQTECLCAKCLRQKPYYTLARSAVIYKTTARDLITDFKYYDKTYIAKYITPYMLRIFKDCQNINIICCVPMHDDALLYRQYNQSAVLSKWLYRQIKTNRFEILFIPDLLLKVKITPRQNTLNKEQRTKNLRNAFKVNDKYKHLIKEKNILLIDDVITTGTTINECAKMIIKIDKTAKVYVLSFARSILA